MQSIKLQCNVYCKICHVISLYAIYVKYKSPLTIAPGSPMAVANGGMGVSFGCRISLSFCGYCGFFPSSPNLNICRRNIGHSTYFCSNPVPPRKQAKSHPTQKVAGGPLQSQRLPWSSWSGSRCLTISKRWNLLSMLLR